MKRKDKIIHFIRDCLRPLINKINNYDIGVTINGNELLSTNKHSFCMTRDKKALIIFYSDFAIKFDRKLFDIAYKFAKDKEKQSPFCNDNCNKLSITEKGQNKQKNKIIHYCKKYKKRLFHNFKHPKIMKCFLCDKLK